MLRRSCVRVRLAWIVSCAILLAALLPMLSHLVPERGGAVWTQICSVTGARFVRIDLGDASSARSTVATGLTADSALVEGAAGLTGALSDPVAGSSTESPTGDAGASMMDRCPYCAIHHGAPALPPAPLAWRVADALAFERPLLFLVAPRPLFAWTPALARAPPAWA